MPDHSAHQKKIIKRYYDNASSIGYQRLQELVSEIYLAEGKKLDRLWKNVESALAKVDVAPKRIEHVLAQRDPTLLANLVQELTGGKR